MIKFLKKCITEDNFDINKQNNNGQTLLHASIINGDKNLFKFLIKNGGNLNIQDNYKRTPIHYFANNLYLYHFLKNNDELLDFNPNIQDIYGKTALHYSIIAENYFLFKFLLDNKVNITICDNDGKNALYYTYNKHSIYKNLLDNQEQEEQNCLNNIYKKIKLIRPLN